MQQRRVYKIYAQNAGVCIRHGAQKQAKRGRVFKRQGKYLSTNNDESTAFGSEFEMTTAAATQSIRDDCASGAGQEGRGAPREVTILCQDTAVIASRRRKKQGG